MKLTEEMMASESISELQLRKMSCELEVLTRPDGSAQFYQGDTSILAAVYGPTEVRINKEKIEKATVEVLFKAKTGLPSCDNKFQQSFLRNTCENAIISSLHPRTGINIIIQEMQDSGSQLACCVNAAFSAMLDACIPLNYSVAAVSCILDKDGEMILDPTRKDAEESQASFTFAFDSQDKNLIMSNSSGIFNNEQYQNCLQMCRKASQHIFDFYRQTVSKKLQKSLSC